MEQNIIISFNQTNKILPSLDIHSLRPILWPPAKSYATLLSGKLSNCQYCQGQYQDSLFIYFHIPAQFKTNNLFNYIITKMLTSRYGSHLIVNENEVFLQNQLTF